MVISNRQDEPLRSLKGAERGVNLIYMSKEVCDDGVCHEIPLKITV